MDKPDGIPDKYQVTVLYLAASNGKIAEGANTKEVLTIENEGKRAETGTVQAQGSVAQANTDYNFVKAGQSRRADRN